MTMQARAPVIIVYVSTDIPPGETLAQYRRRMYPPRVTIRARLRAMLRKI